MFRSPLAATLIVLCWIGSGPTRATAMIQESNFDPGHTLLVRVAEAYQRLPGYADEGTLTLSFSVAGQDESQTIA